MPAADQSGGAAEINTTGLKVLKLAESENYQLRLVSLITVFHFALRPL